MPVRRFASPLCSFRESKMRGSEPSPGGLAERSDAYSANLIAAQYARCARYCALRAGPCTSAPTTDDEMGFLIQCPWALRIRAAAYLTLLNNGHGIRLLNNNRLTTLETEREHWLHSLLLRTSHRYQAGDQSSIIGAFSGQFSASLALNVHLAISVGAQPSPP